MKQDVYYKTNTDYRKVKLKEERLAPKQDKYEWRTQMPALDRMLYASCLGAITT